jgi:hypothetical protein
MLILTVPRNRVYYHIFWVNSLMYKLNSTKLLWLKMEDNESSRGSVESHADLNYIESIKTQFSKFLIFL